QKLLPERRQHRGIVMIFLRYWGAAVALGMIGISAAGAAPPEPVDLGSLTERADDQPISVTIALKLKDLSGAEAMMRRVSTPGDPLYHQFLTPEQVQAQFGPSEVTVAGVIAQLHGRGLSVERTTATTLKATGGPSALERLFQTGLHQFQLPATDVTPASTFRAPIRQPVVPAEVAQAVGAVAGLSTKPVFRPHFRHAPTSLGNRPIKRQVVPGSASALSQPGLLTVTDFAARYNVDALYNQGITGKGGALGIVTFANFTPGDVFAYWGVLNLNVDPKR